MRDYTPETAVQEAVVRLLLADPDVKSIVDDRIYNEPPGDDGETPYINLEGMNSRRMDAGCGTARVVTLRVWAVSGNEFRVAWRLAIG